jgi:MPBQ/MSBQ methyltransferase
MVKEEYHILYGNNRAAFNISSLQLGPKAEDISKHGNPILVFVRFLIGTICATYFFLVPIYMWIKDKIVPRGMPI